LSPLVTTTHRVSLGQAAGRRGHRRRSAERGGRGCRDCKCWGRQQQAGRTHKACSYVIQAAIPVAQAPTDNRGPAHAHPTRPGHRHPGRRHACPSSSGARQPAAQSRHAAPTSNGQVRKIVQFSMVARVPARAILTARLVFGSDLGGKRGERRGACAGRGQQCMPGTQTPQKCSADEQPDRLTSCGTSHARSCAGGRRGLRPAGMPDCAAQAGRGAAGSADQRGWMPRCACNPIAGGCPRTGLDGNVRDLKRCLAAAPPAAKPQQPVPANTWAGGGLTHSANTRMRSSFASNTKCLRSGKGRLSMTSICASQLCREGSCRARGGSLAQSCMQARARSAACRRALPQSAAGQTSGEAWAHLTCVWRLSEWNSFHSSKLP